MLFRPKTVAALTGFGLLALAGQTVSAAPVNCPGTSATTDREFTVTLTIPDSLGSATCIDSGGGNIGGSDSDFAGYTFLDKFEDPQDDSGAANGAITSVTGLGGTAGTFGFAPPSGYTEFIVLFKSGDAQLDPDWAAFGIPNGYTGGDWAISSQGLSHVNLYGKVGEVPLPAAAWLFGSALLGMVGIGYRRRQTA
jgi:hypothetical protein